MAKVKNKTCLLYVGGTWFLAQLPHQLCILGMSLAGSLFHPLFPGVPSTSFHKNAGWPKYACGKNSKKKFQWNSLVGHSRLYCGHTILSHGYETPGLKSIKFVRITPPPPSPCSYIKCCYPTQGSKNIWIPPCSLLAWGTSPLAQVFKLINNSWPKNGSQTTGVFY